MDKKFIKLASEKLAEYLGCKTEDIYVVWQCKILQNIKGMFSSDVPAAIVTGKQPRDRKSTRLNSSHSAKSRMPSSA